MTDQAHIAGLGDADRRTEILRAKTSRGLADRVTVLEAGYVAVETGTYTPTLTGMAIGTGGSVNTGSWTFIGGPDVGDSGVLVWEWRLVFGTSGATFPTAPTVALPAGYNFVAPSYAGLFPVGTCFFEAVSASANSRLGTVSPVSVSTVRMFINGHSAGTGGVTTTTPFTWQVSDGMQGSFTARVVRV
jgi:hypothetical protein